MLDRREALFVRLVTSPTLNAVTTDALHRRFASDGRLLACVNDEDVSATFLSLAATLESARSVVSAIAETIGAAQAVGRAFRLELQHADAATAISDESVRAAAVDLHGALRTPIYIARRAVPAPRWAELRPMGWGAEGLALGESAPALPFGGSESVGVAIEVGAPTVIAKARIVGWIDTAQLRLIAAAAGGPESGLSEVAAYPIVARRDGSAFAVLELSDIKRAPLHRAVRVLEIEARRFGARLGLGALLSNAPLDVFSDGLAAHMGLQVARAQVIETHLAGGATQG